MAVWQPSADHKLYVVVVLPLRAILRMAKQLLPGELPQEGPLKRYDAKADRLAKNNAQKMARRLSFFGDCCRALREHARAGGTGFDQRAAMKKHASAWQALRAEAVRASGVNAKHCVLASSHGRGPRLAIVGGLGAEASR